MSEDNNENDTPPPSTDPQPSAPQPSDSQTSSSQPSPTEPVENQAFRLVFNGEGAEYFRIWIVNLTLSILTLGIYSAWAKVRTNRYFYGSTTLDGDAFEYHAEPLQILKGRIIAIAALAVYILAQTFFPIVSLVLFGAFLLVLPLIVVRSLRFRAIMSSWRGIRFGFDGGVWDAAKAYVFWPLFGIVTLGFGMPYAWYKQNQYTVGNHRFGTTPAHSTTSGSDFYLIFFVIFGIAIVMSLGLGILGAIVAIAAGAGAGAEGAGSDNTGPAIAILAFIYIGYFFMYVLIFAVFQAMRYRLVYSNIVLSDTLTHSDVKVREWTKIVVINSVLLIITLGLYYPWARVKLTNYMVTRTWIESPDLSGFMARTGQDENALGEELGEAFDLGIGI